VARKPEVLVHRSSRGTWDEGRELQRITRTAKNLAGLRQAIAVPLSGQGRPARNTTLTVVAQNTARAQGAGKPLDDRQVAAPPPQSSSPDRATIYISSDGPEGASSSPNIL
jgi:hypothetical protein